VVVDVGLALVLLSRVLVLLVGVLDRGMVVLMVVRGRQVAPVLAVGQVVDDVVVGVAVDHVVVLVAVRHGASFVRSLSSYPPGRVLTRW
jgi:hypothetical protein